MRTITETVVNCFFKTTYIKEVDNSVTLFEGVKGPCHASDLFCPMLDRVIIWERNIIHKSVLEYIESGWFLRLNNIIFTIDKVNTSLSNSVTHLLFHCFNG